MIYYVSYSAHFYSRPEGGSATVLHGGLVEYKNDITENNINNFFHKIRKLADSNEKGRKEPYIITVISWQEVKKAKDKRKKRRWAPDGCFDLFQTKRMIEDAS